MSHLPPSQNEVFRPRAGPRSDAIAHVLTGAKEAILDPFLYPGYIPGQGRGAFGPIFGRFWGLLNPTVAMLIPQKRRFREGTLSKEP